MRHPVLLVPALCATLAAAAPAQTWTQAATAANPGNLRDAAAAFHASGNHTVLFGGYPTLSATWLYDGTNWTAAAPTNTPPGRREFAMVHDLVRGRTVMFGGQGSTVPLQDTWEWDGSNWLPMAPVTVPPARFAHSMAFDVTRGRTVLFGGTSSLLIPRTMTDTWEWNGSNWTRVLTANAPGEAEYSSMCFDIARGVCVLTGGTSFFGAPDQKTWEYDGIDWTDVTATVGPGPTATPGLGVQNAGMVYDPARSVAVLYGGRTPNGTFPPVTWEYDGTAWRQVATGTPTSRTRFAMAMDIIRGVAVLYGGATGNLATWFQETWEYQGGTPASYAVFGPGCAGSAGVPGNVATALPRIGQTLMVTLGNLPAPEAVIFSIGFSDTTSALGPLPLSLAGFGAPACFARTSIAASVLLLGSGGSATFQLPIPGSQSLVGVAFFTQGLVLENGINALGAVVSDAAAAVVGT